jgi:hypothetical protein
MAERMSHKRLAQIREANERAKVCWDHGEGPSPAPGLELTGYVDELAKVVEGALEWNDYTHNGDHDTSDCPGCKALEATMKSFWEQEREKKS